MSNFSSQFESYDLSFLEKGVRLPEIIISKEQKIQLGLKENASNKDYLKKLCWKGFQDKYNSKQIKQSKKECIERLTIEFDVFEKTGVIDYILLLIDIFGWCDLNDVPRGISRGSAAGSFAFYCLGLISINALDHNLNFTRFLSEARVKPTFHDGIMYADGKNIADFDGDISMKKRQKVIERIEKDYAGKTSKISTIRYLTGKMAIKETLKIYADYNEEDARAISGEVESVFGKVDSVADSYEKNANLKDFLDKNPDILFIAKKIENLFAGTGIHASGILISHDTITDMIPLELSTSGEIVSGYSMEHVLSIIAKIDALGLRTTDHIAMVCETIGIKSSDIDINDLSIYRYFQLKDSYYGLFQIESGLTKEVIKKIRPKNIDQLASCISISRPGSLKEIDNFAHFVNTGEKKLIHPQIDKVLDQTGNIILYQEQINNICQQVYGMSATDADEIRRAIGKKIRADMTKWEPILYENGKKNNIPESVTKWFWDTCKASADYLFNANHCYSYSYITAQTTYLKANYPLAFYLVALKLTKEESKSQQAIARIEKEMKSEGFKLLPPDLIKSDIDFKIEGDAIRFGLGSLKGISDQNINKLQNFKNEVNNNKFNLFQSLKNSGLNIGISSALVQSGCLNQFGNRSRLTYELQVFNLLTDKEKSLCLSIGNKPEVNYDVFKAILYLKDNKNDKGKPYISASRFETIKTKKAKYQIIYEQNSKSEALSEYYYEKTILGYSYSQDITSIYEEKIDDLISITETRELPPESTCKFVGFVKNPYKSKTKAGNSCFSMDLSDDGAEIKVKIFNQRISACEEINGRMPEENDLLIVEGKKISDDMIFANRVGIQTTRIFMRLSELKDAKS